MNKEEEKLNAEGVWVWTVLRSTLSPSLNTAQRIGCETSLHGCYCESVVIIACSHYSLTDSLIMDTTGAYKYKSRVSTQFSPSTSRRPYNHSRADQGSLKQIDSQFASTCSRRKWDNTNKKISKMYSITYLWIAASNECGKFVCSVCSSAVSGLLTGPPGLGAFSDTVNSSSSSYIEYKCWNDKDTKSKVIILKGEQYDKTWL